MLQTTGTVDFDKEEDALNSLRLQKRANENLKMANEIKSGRK